MISQDAATQVASTSGAQRTTRSGKRKREYSPIKSMKKRNKVDEDEQGNGWGVTLLHFQAELHKIVFDRQPAGRSSPETALAAETAKLMKEELKQSVSRIFLLRSRSPFY